MSGHTSPLAEALFPPFSRSIYTCLCSSLRRAERKRLSAPAEVRCCAAAANAAPHSQLIELLNSPQGQKRLAEATRWPLPRPRESDELETTVEEGASTPQSIVVYGRFPTSFVLIRAPGESALPSVGDGSRKSKTCRMW